MAQIVGRFFAVAIDAIEVSGFCMAASAFFGLAATLKRGVHIRVNLLIRGMRGWRKRAVELWCTGVGAVAMSYFTTQAVLMVYDTFRFGEKTKGLIIMDLWIPQAAMAAGIAVLAVALADEFLSTLRVGAPSYEGGRSGVLRRRADLVTWRPPASRGDAAPGSGPGRGDRAEPMDPAVVTIILFGFMLALLASGIWVAMSLLAVGFLALEGSRRRRPARCWPPRSGMRAGTGR